MAYGPTTLRSTLTLALLMTPAALAAQRGQYAPRLTPSAQQPGQRKATNAAVLPRDVNARIYLFAFGTGGFGYPARSLLYGPGVQGDENGNGYLTTDSDGLFDLTDHYANACTPTSPDGVDIQTDGPVYLMEADGSTGYGANSANVSVAVMPVYCTQLPNVSNVFVNDLTTVAAAYFFAPFATVSLDALSSDSMISQAVNAAMLGANAVVDSTTGDFTSNTYQNFPKIVQQFNTLADVLAACVDSDPYHTNTCEQIATATTPPGGASPIDSFQAMLDIALYPSNNVQQIYSFATPDSPYQPILAQAPTTWAFAPTANGPKITGVTPQPADPGGQITITGTGFGDSSYQTYSYVVVGGVQAGGGALPVTSWSDSAIVLNVPLDAANGPIQIFSPTGVSQPLAFLVRQPGQASVPKIGSLGLLLGSNLSTTPVPFVTAQGPETMGLVISAEPPSSFGSDPTSFGFPSGSNQVTIDAPIAPIVMPIVPGGWAIDGHSITVQVPVGAHLEPGVDNLGFIRVTVRGQTSSSVQFTVTGDLIPIPNQ